MVRTTTGRTAGRGRAAWRWCAALALLAGLLAGWLPLAQTARAAGITVNSTLDVLDGTDGLCTLREAIIAVNTQTASGAAAGECPAGSGVDTITLAAGATYTLTIPNANPGANETDPASGDLDITAPVAIVVAGGGTATVNANGGVTHDRAFEITSAGVTMTGLTIRNGVASGNFGPGGGGGGFSIVTGGAILTSGAGGLTLIDSTVRDSTAGQFDLSNPNSLRLGLGGGIAHVGSGTLRVVRSTITANGAAEGVGILLGGTGTTQVVNSTLSGNSSNFPGLGGMSFGTASAISSFTLAGSTLGGGAVTIVNATIANNPGGLNTLPSGSSVRHTILANTTTNCTGAVSQPTGDGYNIDSGTSCGFGNTDGSQSTTNPQLRQLALYGGPTATQPPLVGSPAIDKIPVANCTDTDATPLATDQRGVGRPQGALCDIGATEAVATPVPTGVTPASGPTSGGTPLTIAGSNFTPSSTVTVGGAACTNVVITPMQITCTTSPNTVGLKDVIVTNADGVGVTLTGVFTYRAPAITVVVPPSGPVGGGTPITISGSDFVLGATATVGGRPCTAITVAATTITCTTPPGAPGPADVVVVNPNAPGTSGTATGTGKFAYTLTQQANLGTAGLTFAPQAVNTTSGGQTVTLTNGGTAPLVVSAVAIAGSAPSDFAVDGTPCIGSLAAGAGCTVTVTFTPTAPGGRGASLTFTDNSGGVAGSQQSVGLSGTGTAGAVAFGPTSLPFANRPVGTTSPPQTITLTNNGTAPLTIGTIALGGINMGDFILTNTGTGSCTGTVAIGASCAVQVQFRPAAADLRVARVDFTDNASGQPGSIQTVPLSGGGLAATGAVTFGPTSLPFPNRLIGTTSTPQTVTLTNNGTAPLTITAVALGGVNAADFVLTNGGGGSCTGTIAPGASCTVQVQFRPTAADLRVARVDFTDDLNGQPGSVQSVPLSGSGVAPAPTVTFTVTAGAQGSGSVTPAGATSYATGGLATYSAAPATGQVFTGWTLDGIYVGYASPLTFTVSSDRTLVATFVARPTFTDVPTSDPDYTAITTLAALGIINPAGVNGSGQFQPSRAVARAEVAAFIARTFGWEGEFHGNPFPDKCDPTGANCVDDRLWNDVAALRDYGVVGGYNDAATCQALGTTAPCYLPRESVLRVQIVSIVARAFTKAPDLRPTGFWDRLAANPAQYTNVPDAGSQRSDLTTYRANAGPIPGQANDAAFPQPTDPATRRFIIQVLWQAYSAQFGVDRVP